MRTTKFFSSFMTLLIISGILYSGVVTTPLIVLFLSGGLFALFVQCLATFRKYKQVVFYNVGGEPRFEIDKKGKDRKRFDDVVSQIVSQIKTVNDSSGVSAAEKSN